MPKENQLKLLLGRNPGPIADDPNDPAAAQDGVVSGGSVTLTLK